jgi:hypothetical protein
LCKFALSINGQAATSSPARYENANLPSMTLDVPHRSQKARFVKTIFACGAAGEKKN